MMEFVRNVLNLLDAQKSWAPILLRLVVGATFIVHGYGKVTNPEGMFAFAPQIPLGGVLGPLVPFVEFGGGIALVLGLGTRLFAFMQAWVMIFAIAFVHWDQGFKKSAEGGWEWQALILAACLVLTLGGPGLVSIDHFLRKKFLGDEETGDDGGGDG